MKTKFSRSWKSSKQPRKQRKYIANAPLHIKQKFVSSHLSKDLRTRYKTRSIVLKKGDKVKVFRGQFKGKAGEVNRVDLKKTLAYVDGIEITKRDGTKVFKPIHPSNLMIQELNLGDRKRQKIFDRVKK